jgi:ketosteroid isomerase-like protein
LAAEDRRDVEGALSSFSEDCFYKMDTFGIDLRGKAAIADHYRGAFSAMPNFANDKNGRMFDGGDDVFRLGHFQVTQSGPWKDLPASGRDLKVWVLAHGLRTVSLPAKAFGLMVTTFCISSATYPPQTPWS